LTKFSEHWSPKIIAQMNDYHFKLVKFLLAPLVLVSSDFVERVLREAGEQWERRSRRANSRLDGGPI
jgi:hypothetical protein